MFPLRFRSNVSAWEQLQFSAGETGRVTTYKIQSTAESERGGKGSLTEPPEKKGPELPENGPAEEAVKTTYGGLIGWHPVSPASRSEQIRATAA